MPFQSLTVAPRQGPKTRHRRLRDLERLVAETIPVVGGVTLERLLAAGFSREEVDDLSPDLRRRMAAALGGV